MQHLPYATNVRVSQMPIHHVRRFVESEIDEAVWFDGKSINLPPVFGWGSLIGAAPPNQQFSNPVHCVKAAVASSSWKSHSK